MGFDDTHYNFVFECEWDMTRMNEIWRYTLKIYYWKWMWYEDENFISVCECDITSDDILRYTLQIYIWLWMRYEEREWDMTIHIRILYLNVNEIWRVMTYDDTH